MNQNISGPDVLNKMSYTRQQIMTHFDVTYKDGIQQSVLENSSVWTETFHEYSFGNCHTFHPTNLTKAGEVYAMNIGMKVINEPKKITSKRKRLK